MIVKTAHISSVNRDIFCARMTEAIDNLQSEGLRVEVHYQPVNTKDECEYIVYTALLVGRMKGGE